MRAPTTTTPADPANRIDICRRTVRPTARYYFIVSMAYVFVVFPILKSTYKPHRDFLVGAGSSSMTFLSITVARSRAQCSSRHWPVADDVPAHHVLDLLAVAPVLRVAVLQPEDRGSDIWRHVRLAYRPRLLHDGRRLRSVEHDRWEFVSAPTH